MSCVSCQGTGRVVNAFSKNASFCTRCKAGRLALAEYKARAFRQDNALTDGEVKALEVRAEELGITASQLREVMWFWTGKKNFERLTKHEREVVFERLGLEVAA